MEKLKMQSYDAVGANVQKIAQLFPNCVTEILDKDGKPQLAIDFEKLQAELSNDIIAEGQERYQFTWPDKRAANRLANTPTTMTLRPCREESVDFDNTQNLYIEGDNLDVLKVLRETYLGKVKIIYIDPPYNTGNDFVYNDDFSIRNEEFGIRNGFVDEDGNQTTDPMVKNTESNGRFHTDWLNMIYPRLKVARDLLTEDGTIYISLDDNEIYNVKKICDEIFGASNFISNVIWIKKYGIQNDAKFYSTSHDYIMVISKNKNIYKQNLLPRTVQQDNRYKNIDNDYRGPWKAADFTVPHVSSNRIYPIKLPSGRIVTPADGRCWGASEEDFAKMIEDNRVWFGTRGDNIPAVKKFLSEVKDGITATSVWHYDEVSHTDKAKKDLASIMQGTFFDYPKPIELIKKILIISASNDSLILDFFSGSATTAHAVMKLNAEDGGNRKFIMVQLPEKTDEKSEAYKAGYSTICEIGKERIRRAGKKVKEENAEKEGIDKLDIGFRVLKLDSSNMNDVYYTPQQFNMQDLFEENIKPDRTAEDLLFQVMLELGVELSAKIETKQVNGKKVHFVDENYLITCFDADVNESTITEIAKLKPIYFVMRDSSANNDNVIDNFEQIFRHYSPETTCKII